MTADVFQSFLSALAAYCEVAQTQRGPTAFVEDLSAESEGILVDANRLFEQREIPLRLVLRDEIPAPGTRSSDTK
jgi:hypothetical protein